MASKRKKARVTHTKRRKKATPIRRKTMSKKKSTWDTDEEPYADETESAEATELTEEEENEKVAAEQTGGSPTGAAQVVPGAAAEPSATPASEDGVYVVGQGPVAIGTEVYNKGDHVNLTPEELDAVQAAGVQILPAD
jgi:hypothetical protein